MKVTCQSCQAKYTIADEKVRGKVAKIRCKKCGTTIIVNGTDGTTSTLSGGPSSGNSGSERAGAAASDQPWAVFIADDWGLSYLTGRVHATTNYSHVFDFGQRPRDPDPRPYSHSCVGRMFKTFHDTKEWPPPFGTRTI